MSAVPETLENQTPPPEEERRKVGWPKGRPRGPRKASSKPPATELAPAKPDSLTFNWRYYRTNVMDERGKVLDESRKAYYNGAMDTLMLIAKSIDSMPPGFMEWIQECQRGMLARD